MRQFSRCCNFPSSLSCLCRSCCSLLLVMYCGFNLLLRRVASVDFTVVQLLKHAVLIPLSCSAATRLRQMWLVKSRAPAGWQSCFRLLKRELEQMGAEAHAKGYSSLLKHVIDFREAVFRDVACWCNWYFGLLPSSPLIFKESGDALVNRQVFSASETSEPMKVTGVFPYGLCCVHLLAHCSRVLTVCSDLQILPYWCNPVLLGLSGVVHCVTIACSMMLLMSAYLRGYPVDSSFFQINEVFGVEHVAAGSLQNDLRSEFEASCDLEGRE